MKRFIQVFVILMMFAVLTSSCYVSKNINKEDKPLTPDFISTIEAGKRYKFRLKTGMTQTIYVTGVVDETINGFYYEHNTKGKKTKTDYAATFQSIQESVDKIYLLKVSPVLTTVTIAVPTTVVVLLLVHAVDNMEFGM